MVLSPRKRSRWKIGITASVAAIVLAAGTWGAIQWFNARAAKQAADRAEALVANAARTKDYASVRRAYQNGEVDAQTLQVAIRHEFQVQAIDRTDRYFTIKDPKDRQEYLDKVIDEMEQFRSDSRKNAPTTGPTTQPKNNWEAEMVGWALSQPPGERAKLAEFHVAMEHRRAQRGLPSIFDAPGILKRAFSGGTAH